MSEYAAMRHGSVFLTSVDLARSCCRRYPRLRSISTIFFPLRHNVKRADGLTIRVVVRWKINTPLKALTLLGRDLLLQSGEEVEKVNIVMSI